MTELDTAEAIRDGLIPSPQKLGTMELWAIRITGTGMSYRAGLKEYVWRDPDITLTERFVSRCNGLPVIWVHPEKAPKLNSEEFGNRVIGACMLPYIKGNEVWAVCRIYDSDAIEAMRADQLSTSPGVVFTPTDGNQTIDLPNGETFLIEGVPSLLDHIAVVSAGVWDKGGGPTGISTTALTKRTPDMTPEEAAKAESAKLDAVLRSLASISTRMDSMEERKDAEEKAEKEREETERSDKARKDAEEAEEKAKSDKARRDAARKDRFGARKDGESDDDFKKRFDADCESEYTDSMADGCDEATAKGRADKARKDAETSEEKRALGKANETKTEKERDDARKDASAAQAENADLRSKLAGFEAFMAEMKREVAPAERDALAAAQHRADGVAAMFGDRAPAPIPGETSLALRKRYLEKFKVHSHQFKDTRFDSADDGLVKAAEEIIYNDAATAARKPMAGNTGLLIPLVETDDTGRRITKFSGDPMAWMQHYMGQGAHGSFKQKAN